MEGEQKNVANFNPRPLAGATVPLLERRLPPFYFNPRPLAGATSKPCTTISTGQISIHAPLRGRLTVGLLLFQPLDFNPRPLAGATDGDIVFIKQQPISIHAPLRGRPRWLFSPCCVLQFQSTPPCGGDSVIRVDFATTARFQSTPPCGGDRSVSHLAMACWISIHAPLRGRPI